jgi:eukaryotic-like serine/threonine-protein kinase
MPVDPERWRRVEDLFHQALGRPPQERAAWLDRECANDLDLRAEVRSLLENDPDATSFLKSRVGRAVLELEQDRSQGGGRSWVGRRVGAYRLVQELGHGGMGAVYLAVRDDDEYESQVAVKLVRPGLDTDFILRRFRRERQILARLQHPNIARLLDGGTTADEVPYLVMEYVDGSWLTVYAACNKLSVEARLRLFLPICAAVEYAHRNFVVHRDLKPGNILIDASGAPKLLDFGISKLLRSERREEAETHGVAAMTPDYASPEQVLGEPVTTASDVYSLGVVLYELLTGVRPHHLENGSLLMLERAICENETAPPSVAVRTLHALSRRLAGDLDNIVMKAMQKSPERRYASVEQLADDLKRHLEFQPVHARPDSFSYRAGKFAWRNRLTISFAVPAGVALIAAAAVAIHQDRVAHERFDEVRKLATTFVFDVEDATRDLPGSLRARQLIARTGLQYLDRLSESSARDWSLKRDLASAYIRIGQLEGGAGTSNLGDSAAARTSFQKAGVLLDAVLAHNPSDRRAALDRMTVLSGLCNVERQAGQAAASTASCEDGLRRAGAMLAAQQNDLDVVQYAAVFHLDLARLQQSAGDLNRAAAEAASAIRLLEQLSAGRPNDRETVANIGASYSRLGAVLAELGRRDEALANYRRGVEVWEQARRSSASDTNAAHELMLAYSHVGDALGNPAYDNAGDLAGARQVYGKMADLAKEFYLADQADARALSDYGIALLRLGIVAAPEQQLEKRATLEQAHELLSSASEQSPNSVNNGIHKAWAELELADLARGSGDLKAAAHYDQLAMATAGPMLAINPKDSWAQRWLIAAARELAEFQARLGKRSEALATLEPALAIARRTEKDPGAMSVTQRSAVARAWQAAGSVCGILAASESGPRHTEDNEAARSWYQRAVNQWQDLEKRPGFLPAYRRELAAAQSALHALEASRHTEK